MNKIIYPSDSDDWRGSYFHFIFGTIFENLIYPTDKIKWKLHNLWTNINTKWKHVIFKNVSSDKIKLASLKFDSSKKALVFFLSASFFSVKNMTDSQEGGLIRQEKYHKISDLHALRIFLFIDFCTLSRKFLYFLN